MEISSFCMLGGTGFVGQAIADAAAQRDLRVRVLTRYEPSAARLKVLPTVEVMVGDPHDEATLARAFEGMDAVVNLVGILHASGRESFARVHAELPRKAARACRASGVQHLLHMSALGASDKAPSEYLRSKAAGEAAVRLEAGIVPWTIFRPSVIFGSRDRLLNVFATLARFFPMIPLAAAEARFQPVWVDDVARCFVSALGEPRAFGEACELCGPRVYTLRELVEYAAAVVGKPRRVVPLGPGLADLQAAVFEHLPGKLITRDNLRSMSVPNVCSGRFPAWCDAEPAAMEAIAPEYLSSTTPRGRYARYRHEAGR